MVVEFMDFTIKSQASFPYSLNQAPQPEEINGMLLARRM